MVAIGFDVFWRDRGARRGAREVGDEFDRTAVRSDRMRDAVKAGAIGATLAIGLFGKKSVEIASDVAESQSKISVVFGKSAQSVLDFGETSGESLGISKRAALEAAGTFGNLFVSLKLPQAEAAKMSTKMITLAADMASFNNASPEEALEAIRSGLVGETEPLRRFGVNMNDATLRTQALKDGLISNTKEALSPAVKAQAAYGLMLAQTGTAQGDFARTSDGLANQQRILAARFEDLQAKLGEKLLPVVTKVMSGLLGLLEMIIKNQHVIIPMATACTVLAVSIWGVNKAALGATKSLAAWNIIMGLVIGKNTAGIVSMYRVQAAMVAAAGSAGVVAVAFAAVWADEKLRQWDKASVSVERLAKGMEEVKGKGRLSGAEIELFQSKMQLVGNKIDTSSEALKEFGWQAHDALDQGWAARIARIDDMGKGQKTFAERTKSLDGAFADMVRNGNIAGAQKQMELYENAARDAGLPIASLRKMFPQYAAAVAAAKPPVTALTDATKKHTGAVKLDSAALLAQAQALLKTRGSHVAFEASVDDASKALKENGRTLDIHTAKGRTNRTALDQIASSTLQWRDAAKEAGASQKRQTQITEQGRAELVRMGQRFGLSKKAAKEYAREVLGIPKRVSSTISLSLQNGIPRTLYGVRIGGGQGSTRGGITFNAAGGAIRGPGSETSDSIPAMLSHNEHVWTAREVHAAGGHDAVKGMRRAVLGLAAGGPVFASQFARGEGQLAAGTSSRLGDRLLKVAQSVIGFNANLTGVVNFARAQVGKPYIWGGVGPRGYDCSGAMSALLNVAQGRNPYSRRGTTATFPWPGFVSGPGAFMIGAFRGNPGHMAGTVNGVNVESSGSAGFHMGRSARGARSSMFSRVAHLRGFAKGGPVTGDAPFDLLNPGGDDYLGDAIRRVFLADSGGVMRSGEGSINLSGQNERVLSGRQTRAFDRMIRVVDRSSRGGADARTAAPALDYDRLADAQVRAFLRAGLHVKMDSRTVGQVMGSASSLLGRAG
jgi:hypothetical protein